MLVRIQVSTQGPSIYKFGTIGYEMSLMRREYYRSRERFGTTSTYTSSLTKVGDSFLAGLNMQFKNYYLSGDFKVDPNSRNFFCCTLDERVPGLKMQFSCIDRLPRLGKVGVQWQNKYITIDAMRGNIFNPMMECSAVLGNKSVSLGSRFSFNHFTRTLIECDAGFSFFYRDMIASLTLKGNADTLNASLCHTAVGAELVHKFSTKESTLTVGTQYVLDPSTVVKARANNHGKLSTTIQHEWAPKSFVTFTTEVDMSTLKQQGPKFGLALALDLEQIC
ncbi:Voltage-dependent anion-selective channel protein 1 [Ranunculus cassubicifolius]